MGGGYSGLLIVGYKGKVTVYRVDPGVVSLGELRAHGQQAATELEQWKIRTVVEATRNSGCDRNEPVHDSRAA